MAHCVVWPLILQYCAAPENSYTHHKEAQGKEGSESQLFFRESLRLINDWNFQRGVRFNQREFNERARVFSGTV